MGGFYNTPVSAQEAYTGVFMVLWYNCKGKRQKWLYEAVKGFKIDFKKLLTYSELYVIIDLSNHKRRLLS